MLKMDMKILENPATGEIYRKLKLLKGVNASSSLAAGSDSAMTFLQSLLQ